MELVKAVFDLVHGLLNWTLWLLILSAVVSVWVFMRVFRADFDQID